MSNLKLEFLKKEIDKSISSIKDARNFYRKESFTLFLSTTILASLTTVLLGLKLKDDYGEIIRIISLLLTSAIAIISAYNSFFSHKEMWLANNSALNKLYELKFDIHFMESEMSDINTDLIEGFKKRYQVIHNQLNETWTKSRGVKK